MHKGKNDPVGRTSLMEAWGVGINKILIKKIDFLPVKFYDFLSSNPDLH